MFEKVFTGKSTEVFVTISYCFQFICIITYNHIYTIGTPFLQMEKISLFIRDRV